MKRLLILTALLTATAIAQTPPKTAETGDGVYLTLTSFTDMPTSFHDEAVKEIKAFHAHQLSKFHDATPTDLNYIWNLRTPETASVGDDGKITLGGGLTMEELALRLVAQKESAILQEEYAFDQRMDEEEKATADHPPDFVLFEDTELPIYDVPEWNPAVAGDTTCVAGKADMVRILNTYSDKPMVLMHELMHVADGCKDTPDFHLFIGEVAPGLVKILRDNPQIADYFVYGSHENPCPPAGCDDGWDWSNHLYDCVKNGKFMTSAGKSCKEVGLGVAKWPTVGVAHIVLDPAQAKEQDHPVPVCTPESDKSTASCYDPNMPHLEYHLYEKKDNCESEEGVKCASLRDGSEEGWVPIGKPVVKDRTEN